MQLIRQTPSCTKVWFQLKPDITKQPPSARRNPTVLQQCRICDNWDIHCWDGEYRGIESLSPYCTEYPNWTGGANDLLLAISFVYCKASMVSRCHWYKIQADVSILKQNLGGGYFINSSFWMLYKRVVPIWLAQTRSNSSFGLWSLLYTRLKGIWPHSMMNKVKDNLDAKMNFINAHDHVSKAEGSNWMIKECIQTMYQCLPYLFLKAILLMMIRYLATNQGTNRAYSLWGREGSHHIIAPRDTEPDKSLLQERAHCAIWLLCTG